VLAEAFLSENKNPTAVLAVGFEKSG